MHITSLAADERFISLNGTSHLVDASSVHRVPNTVEHKPCRALSNFDSVCDFVATDPVLTVREEPHCRKPFVERNCAVLKDRAYLNRELLFAIKALPHQSRSKKR